MGVAWIMVPMPNSTIDYPFYNPDLPAEERVSDLLSRLTLEEKVAQMLHSAPPVERLGIPAYDWWNECLHGVARAGMATVFPQAIAFGATFDPELIGQVATAISDEARAKHHAAAAEGNRGRYRGLTFWSPNINIFRDPRWGRGHETYGEDPFLTGEIGKAFVRGLQGEDPNYLKLAACAKHYAVHSGPEAERHTFDAICDEQDLWDTYLPAFEQLVTQAKVEIVMGAYNRVNGHPCCAHPQLIGEILRGKWGFGGHFVSDCWAIVDFYAGHKVFSGPAEASAAAVKEGCDLCCGCAYEHLVDAVKNGLISEAELDVSLARLIRTKLKLGLFDPPERVPFATIPQSKVGCEDHRRLARETAVRSMVLLKNNGILPINPKVKSIYVCGPNAADIEPLIGNYYGASPNLTTVLEGIVASVPHSTTVEYRRGCELAHPKVNPIDWVTDEAALNEVCVAVMGLSQLLEGEEGDAIANEHKGDRVSIELPPHQLEFLRKLKAKGARLVVVMCAGSPIAMPEVHELADAILWAWYPGEAGGHAVADVLFGRRSPGGRLPVTFPRSTADLPPYSDYSMQGRTYRYMEADPLYPFGFGLTYSKVSYREAKLTQQSFAHGDRIYLDATIINNGSVPVDEVVQLYVSPPKQAYRLPQYALRGFQRVSLQPSESRQIRFEISEEQLRFVNDKGVRLVPTGIHTIHVGSASPHPRSVALGAPVPASVKLDVKG